MYTQCPQCMTYFQVTAEHLKIAQGNVRCGQCRNVFSALGNLTEKLPDMSGKVHEQVNNQYDEHVASDFLTDEELDEFEEFDTNIYDDEDTVFDAMLDGDDTNVSAQPVSPASPPARSSGNENLSKAIEKINQLNKESSKKLYGLDLDKTEIIEKLKQHESAIVAKLKQQEQEELQQLMQEQEEKYHEEYAVPDNQVAQTPPPQAPKPAPQQTPQTQRHPSAPAQQSQAQPENETDVRKLRKSAKKKQDIPVQTSNDAVNIDDALQAIDQLDLNDESAQFVASVVEEFQSTQLTAPTAEDNAEKISKRKRLAKKLARLKAEAQSLTKAAKSNRIDPQQFVDQMPPQSGPINPDLIPTLPAILQEQFQQDAAEHHISKASVVWGVASFLLMLVFLFQTVYFKHDQLAQVSQFRPWIERFCRHMNCSVALQFNAKKLELLGQDIRTHPKVKGALMVSTTIINNAPHTQAYPGLQITFSDLNGQKVAMRRFLPNEYLPKKSKIEKGMPSETPIQVEIELMDPGSKAVNFEFEFFKAS